MNKLSYREIMKSVKEENKKLPKSHVKVIKKALEESDLDENTKEFERINIEELEDSL